MRQEEARFLVVGLGNVGDKYCGTRHNVGFGVIGKLAKLLDVSFSTQKKLLSEIAVCQGFILAKPQTYMNRSGLALAKVRDFYKVSNEKIIVVCDDFNLKLGKIRIRFDGNSGGHNGLDSVMEQIGGNFWRVRIGIGEPVGRRADVFVLEKFLPEERRIINLSIDRVASYLLNLHSRELKNESINVGGC